MTDLERAEAAFVAAHKAGDSKAAGVLAQRVRDLRASAVQPSGSANAGGAGAGAGAGKSSAPEGIPGLVPGTKTIPSDSTTGTGMLTGDESAAERARLGLAGVGIQTYLGTKNNLGPLTHEEQNVLQQSKDDVERSGPAGKIANTLGQVGEGVATSMLLPPLKIAQHAGPVLKGVINYVKNAGAAAAQEGITAPADDQEAILSSKLKQAGIAGGLGLGLKGVTDVLQMPMRGMFRATKDTIDLMRQGVNPTLQQGADSPLGRFIGGLTSGAMKTGERQGEEVKEALAKRVSRGQYETGRGETLNELTGNLEASVGRDKEALFDKKRLPLTNKTREEMLTAGDNIKQSGGRLLDQQNEARRVLDNIVGSDTHNARITNRSLQEQYLDPLDHEIGRARDPKVAEALQEAKAILEKKARMAALKPEERATLEDINSRLYDIARMNEAKGADGELTGFKIKQLVKAYGAQPDAALNATNQELIGPLGRAMGRAPNQDQSRSLLVNTARVLGGLGTAGAVVKGAPVMALPYAISLAGQTGKGARALFGQTNAQRKLTSAFDSPATDDVTFANMLRALRDNASNQGASFTGN